jgi:hypothetical protein
MAQAQVERRSSDRTDEQVDETEQVETTHREEVLAETDDKLSDIDALLAEVEADIQEMGGYLSPCSC